MFRLIHHSAFQRIWAVGAVLSLLRWLDALVLGVFVYDLTASASKVAVVFFFRLAPQILFGLLIGTLADRVSRKRLLVTSLFALAVVAACVLALIITGRIQYWHLCAAVFISGVFLTCEFPARRAMIGDLVPTPVLARALSLDIATSNLMRVLGPLLGGALLNFWGAAAAYALAAGLFAAAALVAAVIPYRWQVAPGRQHPLREIAEGLRYIRKNDALVSVLAVTVLMNLCAFPYMAMVPVIGAEVLGADAMQIGFLSAAEGVGATLSSLWIASRAGAHRFLLIFAYGSGLSICCILAFSQSPFYFLSLLLLFAGGLGLAGFSTMQTTILVSASEASMRGRVLGTLALCIGAQPLGALQVAFLAQLFLPQTTVLIIAIEALLALAATRLIWPILWRRADAAPE